jgi:hypothetical protein
MGNMLRKQITPPAVDAMLMVITGLVCLALGGDVLRDPEHARVGWMIFGVGALNLFNAARIWRRLRAESGRTPTT